MSHKDCSEQGCTNKARGKFRKCFSHGGGKQCDEPNCTKSARSKSDKCVEHGGGKRCSEINCPRSARPKSDKCVKHGGGPRCNAPNCTKAAVSKSDKCVEHGGGQRCNAPNCTNVVMHKNTTCKEHGGKKKCTQFNCFEAALNKNTKCKKHGGKKICNTKKCKNIVQGKSDKCLAHGGGSKCPNCINWIDSRCRNSKYDGYCATCFKVLFPDDERSKVIYSHTKEIRVRNAINEKFKGFVHDKPLYTGNCDCTHRRRVDHRKLIGNTVLAIETDEFAHKDYSPLDEEIRYDDLYMIHSGKWIFIRFNPDGIGVDMEDKLVRLIEEIETQIARIEKEENNDLLEIIKMYY